MSFEWIPIWRSYADLKIAKLRESLAPARASASDYVFGLYRAHVEAFLGWVEEGLAQIDWNDQDSSDWDSRRLLECLDSVAHDMRFYVSAARARRPHPLLEHYRLASAGEARADAVLLRPQSDQTFETRSPPQSLRIRLCEQGLTLGYSWRQDVLKTRLGAIPDVFVISYPGLLGEVYLFYPIVGHEFGHVLYALDQGKLDTLNARISNEDVRISGHAERKLARRWALELFCDRVGLHLSGESFVYSLWLLLCREPLIFKLIPFEQFRERDPASVLEKAAKLVAPLRDRTTPLSPAEASTLADDITYDLIDPTPTTYPWETYPSLGQRLKRLATLVKPVRSSSVAFSAWREEFLNFFVGLNDPGIDSADSTYGSILAAASDISDKLYESALTSLPPAADDEPTGAKAAENRAEELDQLTTLLREWIPPCETQDAGGALRPASWPLIILAGWIRFVELSLEPKDRLATEAWPAEHMHFVHEALDMNAFYRTFREVRTACSATTTPTEGIPGVAQPQ